MTSSMRPRVAAFGAVLLGFAVALVLSWTNVGVMELWMPLVIVLPVVAILAIAFAVYKILMGMQSKLDRIESELDLVGAHDVA